MCVCVLCQSYLGCVHLATDSAIGSILWAPTCRVTEGHWQYEVLIEVLTQVATDRSRADAPQRMPCAVGWAEPSVRLTSGVRSPCVWLGVWVCMSLQLCVASYADAAQNPWYTSIVHTGRLCITRIPEVLYAFAYCGHSTHNTQHTQVTQTQHKEDTHTNSMWDESESQCRHLPTIF